MPKRKKVLCFETGVIYDSAITAEKATGIRAANIACSCRMEQNTSNGVHWRYFTMEDEGRYSYRIVPVSENIWKIDFSEMEMKHFMGRNGTIYMYTNKVNGKKYIGQTWHPEVRHKQHLKQAYNKGRDTFVFHHALNKYGEEGFHYTKLHEHIDTSEKLDRLEKEAIEKYDSIVPKGYNVKGGGSGGGAVRYEGVLNRMGWHARKEVYCIDLAKKFPSLRNATRTLGHNNNIDYARTSYAHEANKWWYSHGHYWQWVEDSPPLLTIEEVSEIRRAYLAKRNDKSYLKKKVICIETQKVYNSIGEAAEDIEGNVTNITAVCKKKKGFKATKTYLGYHWDYYEEGKGYSLENYEPAGHVCPVRCIETGKVYNNMKYAAMGIAPDADKEEWFRIGVCIHHSIKTKCAGNGFHWEYYEEGRPPASLDSYKKSNLREVVCIDTGKGYRTTQEAALDIGCAPTNIVRCCRGKAKTVYGLRWKYKEDV